MTSTPSASLRESGRSEIPDVVEALLGAWGEIQNIMTRLPGIVEDRFGIPPHRLQVIGAVERGARRMQEIADGSWTSVSAASRTVDGLVRDGWLDREPDPDDRRATMVTITPHGDAEMERVRTWARGMVAEMVEALGVARADRMANDLSAFAERIQVQIDRDVDPDAA